MTELLSTLDTLTLSCLLTTRIRLEIQPSKASISSDANRPYYSTSQFWHAPWLIPNRVLEHALSADFPPYDSAVKLRHRILEYEDSFPFRLRCRASMRANITRYPSPAKADAASPPPRSDDSRLLFQQHALALGCCTSIFSLIRLFFVAALSLSPEDPSKTPYGEAFLMMVERCGVSVSQERY